MQPWRWPLRDALPGEVPTSSHHGGFGAQRKHDIHTGIDLYCDPGEIVCACEDGVVVAIDDHFTGPDANPPSPHWRPTSAILIEGASGVILYGEVRPFHRVHVGQHVHAGEDIASVLTILQTYKGRPMTMLHLELYTSGTREAALWLLDTPQPLQLCDPTPMLLTAHLGAVST